VGVVCCHRAGWPFCLNRAGDTSSRIRKGTNTRVSQRKGADKKRELSPPARNVLLLLSLSLPPNARFRVRAPARAEAAEVVAVEQTDCEVSIHAATQSSWTCMTTPRVSARTRLPSRKKGLCPFSIIFLCTVGRAASWAVYSWTRVKLGCEDSLRRQPKSRRVQLRPRPRGAASNFSQTQLESNPTCRKPNLSNAQLVANPTCRKPNLSHAQLVAHPTCRTPNLSQTQLATCPSWACDKLGVRQNPTCRTPNLSQTQLATCPTCRTPNSPHAQLVTHPTRPTPNSAHAQSTSRLLRLGGWRPVVCGFLVTLGLGRIGVGRSWAGELDLGGSFNRLFQSTSLLLRLIPASWSTANPVLRSLAWSLLPGQRGQPPNR